ncbi:hypothetical protein PN441_16135 [Spirulina major CS-329]|jgi:hypothetical protein|uniref:hypothetical protein n=1 Tax=Spirulina TaxID=1154 RepID=UPI0009340904|nr:MULTISPECIES: hypothetical protein [Spirulina]MDB9493591.1 hypothetical protein [Spirulina subsalsa CS-330]MDB9504608.1 hypothetical protein [Spirulina major CS-329]
MDTLTLVPNTVKHRIRLSETLYEIYSKIHRVHTLTNVEYQILYTLKQDQHLSEDHRNMLTRIFYTLEKHDRYYRSSQCYA